MFLRKFKRQSNEAKDKYLKEVQVYIKNNGIAIVEKLYDYLDAEELRVEELEKIFGDNYPRAPWIESSDNERQVVCLLEQMGYVFTYNKNGNISLKNEQLYRAIVQNHLKLSGNDILERLSYYCEKTNGRISYEQMQVVLGLHYPKAPYITEKDIRISIILFLKETGLPFIFDETHVYFP